MDPIRCSDWISVIDCDRILEVRLTAIAAAGVLITSAGAVEVTKVWDVSKSSFPKDLPVRVEKASARQVWLLDKKPSMLTLTVTGDGVVETKPFESEEPPVGYPGNFWFSKDGELAVHLPSWESGVPQVLKFDPSRRQFETFALPFRNLAGFAVGSSRVAVLVEEGVHDRFDPPEKLVAYLVSHDGTSLVSERLWEENEFTKHVSASLSNNGVLATIAAKTAKAPGGLGLDHHGFALIVHQGSDTKQHSVDGLNQESVVAVSEDGKWLATGTGQSIHVHETETLAEVTSIANICATQPASVRVLSVGTDQSVGAACIRKGGWEVVLAAGTECTQVAAYRFEDVVEINLHVLPRGRVYVATVGRLTPSNGNVEVFARK